MKNSIVGKILLEYKTKHSYAVHRWWPYMDDVDNLIFDRWQTARWKERVDKIKEQGSEVYPNWWHIVQE